MVNFIKLSKLTIVLAAIGMLASGCWDRIEIDERGFVVGVGIDKPPEPAEGEEEKKAKRYKGTYQIIKPSGLASGAKGSSTGQASVNVEAEEDSMPTITAKISSITGRSPFFEHLKLIVISAEIARSEDAVTDIADYFLRDVEMRRDIKVIITPGKAQDILNVVPFNEKYPVAYIQSVVDNTADSSYILPETRIGALHEYLLRDDSFALQLAREKNNILSLAGSAVFDGKRNTLIGFLSGMETQGLNFMRGEIKGGILKADYEGSTVDLEIELANRKIHVDIQSPRQMTFTIDIMLEGMLEKSPEGNDVIQKDILYKMQEAMASEIEANCQATITKLQKKYKQDVIGLGSWLKRNHYRTWKQVGEQWNADIFPNIDVVVHAKVEIRRSGNVIMTDNRRS